MNTIKKQLRKAFTIVELVIVIAVIAALAAVLIPTFVNVLSSANESADTQMLANINKALAAEDILHDIETPEQALDVAEDAGYNLQNLTPSSEGNYIVYDQNTVSFALVSSEDEILYSKNDETIDLNAPTTWYFATSQFEIESGTTHSYILTGDWSSSTADAGKTAVKSIKSAVDNTTSNSSTIVTYTGMGALDTSKASGIEKVAYNYKLADNTTYSANIVINVYSDALVIDLSNFVSGTNITINTYGDKDLTLTITSTKNVEVTVTLNNNNNKASCYVEETVTANNTLTGITENEYTEVKQGSYSSESGTLEVGTESYPYLIASESDFDKINYGGYCLVTAEFTSTTALTVNENVVVTLDLAGYSVTISGYELFMEGYYAGLINNGTLTITSRSEDTVGELILSGASYGICNNSNLVLENGKVNATYSNSDSAANAIINNAVDATITINGGEIYAARRAVFNKTGSLEVNGGTISSAISYGNGGAAISNANTSSLIINGGNINGYNGVYNSSSTDIYINGGNISGYYGLYNGSSASAIIYISCVNLKGTYQGLTSYGGSIVVGELEGNNDNIKISSDNVAVYVDYTTVLDVYSGTINGEVGIQCVGREAYGYSTLSVYGGVISATDGFAICGNGTKGQGYDKIYIYGGTITSTSAQAIYNPQQEGETYIYGGTISGTSGIEIRNGYVYIGEVDGKTIDTLYIKATYRPSYTEENHNGSTTDGAAIAISAYNLVDITVEIGKGTYEGYYSFYEYYVNGDYDNDGNELETPNKVTVEITITITDGDFDGIVYSQNKTGFVCGGTFTVDPTSYVDTVSCDITTNSGDETTYTVKAKAE